MAQTVINASLDSRAYAQIGEVGFGAIGQAVLAQWVDLYEQKIEALCSGDAIPLVEFTIWNDGQDSGFGQAYDLQTMLYLLNFPVQANPRYMGVDKNGGIAEMGSVTGMHLREGRVNELKDWLEMLKARYDDESAKAAAARYEDVLERECGGNEEKLADRFPDVFSDYMLSRRDGKAWNEKSYLPRGLYRGFLLDQFRETVGKISEINGKLGLEAIRLNLLEDCLVTDVRIDGEDLFVTSNVDMQPSKAFDALVVATGHHHGNLINGDVRKKPNFADTPLGDGEMSLALSGVPREGGKVVILGMGASYVDALRALKAEDYKGDIVVLAGTPMDFWPMDPSKDDNVYERTSQFVDGIVSLDGNEDAITQRFIDEVFCSACIECGPQNFFIALQDQDDFLKTSLSEDSYQAYRSILKRASSRWTAPESCKVINAFRDSGQIQIVSSRFKALEFCEDKTWRIDLANGNVIENAGAIVDCAGLATKVVGRDGHISDPLIRTMVANNVAEVSQESGLAQSRVGARLAFAGPAGTNSRAIPYTRALNKQAAAPTLDEALALAQARMKEAGIEAPVYEL
jgi:hypothetical protein